MWFMKFLTFSGNGTPFSERLALKQFRQMLLLLTTESFLVYGSAWKIQQTNKGYLFTLQATHELSPLILHNFLMVLICITVIRLHCGYCWLLSNAGVLNSRNPTIQSMAEQTRLPGYTAAIQTLCFGSL